MANQHTVNIRTAPSEPNGKTYLAAGENVALRAWFYNGEQPPKEWESHDYETVGYVIDGDAELHFADGRVVQLDQGDSWLVPANTRHRYNIDGYFRCVEATSPATHNAPV